ncbi:type II toxin-antitoxin system HicB family antitoxin [Pedobacter cryotolerans]|uniref:Uncharacterized protein n=1 Tax=Pedobacter cryotolerans TaxID=2571270 RepID=A0A4U1CEP7_9SPHI|nr:hypothetical protein [Pedobacter cryotolerans]TKC02694.1 hypothetical protein FA045_05300 [Pedobacter cryotolerans]
MREIKENLKIDYKHKRGKGVFRILEFEDHGHHIVYIPSLKLSSYGNTADEAQKMMGDVILEDFFENLFEQSEKVIFDYLKNLGWSKSSIYPKELSNDVHIDTYGILKNFNLSSSTKVTEKLVEV